MSVIGVIVMMSLTVITPECWQSRQFTIDPLKHHRAKRFENGR